MGWSDVEERRGGAGAGFLSLKDGDAKKIHIIDDEPYTFSSVFFNAVKRSAVVDPDDNPVKGVKGFDVRKRHAINVYDYDDQKVKVMAGSNEMFNQLKGIREEWEGFENLDLKISRTGSGFDTKYQIVPTPKCMWDPSLIEGQEVFDLATVFAVTPDETIQAYMEGMDPSTEFDPEKMDDAGDELPADAEEPVEDEEPVGEETLPRKTTARPASAPKPVAKANGHAAPAPAAMGRNELIMKLNHAMKNKLRYKKPGVWKADVQKFGGKDKTSMSQLGADALLKLLKFVQTCK